MPTQTGQRNAYTCTTCRDQIITVNLEDGTTPFMICCRKCDGAMHSAFGQVPLGNQPTHGWHKPKGDEYDHLDRLEKDHVDKGGLLLRELTPEEKAVYFREQLATRKYTRS